MAALCSEAILVEVENTSSLASVSRTGQRNVPRGRSHSSGLSPEDAGFAAEDEEAAVGRDGRPSCPVRRHTWRLHSLGGPAGFHLPWWTKAHDLPNHTKSKSREDGIDEQRPRNLQSTR